MLCCPSKQAHQIKVVVTYDILAFSSFFFISLRTPMEKGLEGKSPAIASILPLGNLIMKKHEHSYHHDDSGTFKSYS